MVSHSNPKREEKYIRYKIKWYKQNSCLVMDNEKHEFHIALESEIFDKLESIKEYHRDY